MQPTLSGRLTSLDIARGFAVLGILLANIIAFHYPVLADELGQKHVWVGVDLWIERLTAALVNGKFRGLLCILFGVGMWLQFQSRTRSGGDWPGSYLKRMFVLFAIGAIHGFFIWYGDILSHYAITALMSFWVVKLPTPTLVKIIAGLAAFSVTCGVALGSMGNSTGIPPESLEPIQGLINGELAAYRDGSYGQQFLYRGTVYILSLPSAPFLAPSFMMLFIFGVLLGRAEFFRDPNRAPALRNWMLIVGFGIGLPLNGVSMFLTNAQLGAYVNFLEIAGGALLSVGYLVLLVLLLKSRIVRWLLRPLENVGRIALTCYLMQSLLCTTFFYSYGLGYFATLTRSQLLLVVLGVWIVNLVFAAAWLRFFTIGPVECLWRAWSEGSPLDLRQKGRQEISAPPVLNEG